MRWPTEVGNFLLFGLVFSPLLVEVGEVRGEGDHHLVVRNGLLSRHRAVILHALSAALDPARHLWRFSACVQGSHDLNPLTKSITAALTSAPPFFPEQKSTKAAGMSHANMGRKIWHLGDTVIGVGQSDGGHTAHVRYSWRVCVCGQSFGRLGCVHARARFGAGMFCVALLRLKTRYPPVSSLPPSSSSLLAHPEVDRFPTVEPVAEPRVVSLWPGHYELPGVLLQAVHRHLRGVSFWLG